MNPLTNVKNITKLNETELATGLIHKKSWHDMYKDSAWIFIGGLEYGLTEGDIIAVFSQYGEVVNLNLVRDKKSGKSKGFCFLCYQNQKSTVLAVDNLNGIKLCHRTIRVDHVANYKPPKEDERDDEITKMLKSEGCAPMQMSSYDKTPSANDHPKKKKSKKAPYKDPMINEGLFEGDIIGIDPNSDRNAVFHDYQRWPEGIVPYIIDPDREDIKDLILEAMRYLESYSCLRFVERTNENDYIKIFKHNGCYSHWGRTGGEQKLSLGSGCENFAIVVHEIMHAIGFEHEHNRSDRDEYLIINWDNIVEEYKYAFRKLRPDQNRLLTQFDFSSLMLYGSYSFAKEPGSEKYSMVRKDGKFIEEIYNRKSMSVLDAKRINMLYQCKETEDT